MEKIKKILVVAIVGILANFAVISQSCYAASSYDCENHFLGLRAWYDGVVDKTTCKVYTMEEFAEAKGKSNNPDDAVRLYVWTVGLNIASMITGIAGYVAIGMVIWGGFLYMLAQGDVGKVAKGKKAITNSIIGLILVMTASIISGTIASIVSGAEASGDEFFLSIFNKAFLWSGIVAVIMIVYGGLQYVTSAGDPNKTKKAKNTILYSVIGLLVIIFAATIINFVVGAVGR